MWCIFTIENCWNFDRSLLLSNCSSQPPHLKDCPPRWYHWRSAPQVNHVKPYNSRQQHVAKDHRQNWRVAFLSQKTIIVKIFVSTCRITKYNCWRLFTVFLLGANPLSNTPPCWHWDTWHTSLFFLGEETSCRSPPRLRCHFIAVYVFVIAKPRRPKITQ